MKAYLIKVFAAVLVAGVVFTIGLQLWLPHSALFHAAREYISTSEPVAAAVGNIASLDPSAIGFSMREAGQDGEGRLPVVIRGSTAKRRAILRAVKRDGTWSVKQLTLN
jgi:hypothetical protein